MSTNTSSPPAASHPPESGLHAKRGAATDKSYQRTDHVNVRASEGARERPKAEAEVNNARHARGEGEGEGEGDICIPRTRASG